MPGNPSPGVTPQVPSEVAQHPWVRTTELVSFQTLIFLPFAYMSHWGFPKRAVTLAGSKSVRTNDAQLVLGLAMSQPGAVLSPWWMSASSASRISGGAATNLPIL